MRVGFGIEFGSLRKRKQGIGVNIGDGSALGESDRDIRRGDMLGELGDDENIERAEGKE